MRESSIEKAICAHAIKTGWRCYKFVSPGNRGVPDRQFRRKGKLIYLEVKAPGKKPTPLQLREIQLANDDGFPAAWTDSVEDGKAFLDACV